MLTIDLIQRLNFCFYHYLLINFNLFIAKFTFIFILSNMLLNKKSGIPEDPVTLEHDSAVSLCRIVVSWVCGVVCHEFFLGLILNYYFNKSVYCFCSIYHHYLNHLFFSNSPLVASSNHYSINTMLHRHIPIYSNHELIFPQLKVVMANAYFYL